VITSYIKKRYQAMGISAIVQHLTSRHKALGFYPQCHKKKNPSNKPTDCTPEQLETEEQK
jgi:hypothetical protein